MQLVDHKNAKTHDVKSIADAKKIATDPKTATDNYSVFDGDKSLLRVCDGKEVKVAAPAAATRPTAAEVEQPTEGAEV